MLILDDREKFIIQTGAEIMLISYSYKKLFKFENGLQMAGQWHHSGKFIQSFYVFY